MGNCGVILNNQCTVITGDTSIRVKDLLKYVTNFKGPRLWPYHIITGILDGHYGSHMISRRTFFSIYSLCHGQILESV